MARLCGEIIQGTFICINGCFMSLCNCLGWAMWNFFMTHGSVKTAIVCWSDAACRVLCLLSEHGPLSEVIVC